MFNALLLFLISLTLLLAVQFATSYHFGNCLTRQFGEGKCTERKSCDFYNINLLDGAGENQCYSRMRPNLICCPTTPYAISQLSARIGTVDELPKHPHCGTSFHSKVWGGNQTDLFEFPWTTLLEYTKTSNGNKLYDCGAAFIAQRWLLTAAHCVHKHFLKGARVLTGARLGEWNTTSNPDCVTYRNGKQECAPPYIQATIDLQVTHEEFDLGNLTHDIALLRLSEPVNWHIQKYLEPVCLPPASGESTDQLEGSAVDVSGWGITEMLKPSDVKRKATLYVTPQQSCAEQYSAQGYVLNNGQFCASGGLNVDSCLGDSGSPVTIEASTPQRDRYVYLVGIVSFGRLLCGQSDFPGVYTRVSNYVDWIEKTISKHASN
ncbi:serine protease easter [Drosophila grimshawi]|uniref:GH11805 n=1 Tax=Drosophila grimshawi TaxID=7222 RepID=B4JIU0_DROGR|nr:serine protease easter [Drosophila grimshawi]EDW00537.1 GH11805 [Drosophila grimshawi]